MQMKRPLYLRRHHSWDVLPHSTRRIEADYIFAVVVVLAVIAFMIVRSL